MVKHGGARFSKDLGSVTYPPCKIISASNHNVKLLQPTENRPVENPKHNFSSKDLLSNGPQTLVFLFISEW